MLTLQCTSDKDVACHLDKIWVLGWDFGVEGKTEPVAAYCSEKDALEAKAIIESNPSATAPYVTELQITSRERAV